MESTNLNKSANTPTLNLALDELEDTYGMNPPPEAIEAAFTAWVENTGKTMYPHQAEALFGIVAGDHVIVSTPTGSGKSLIAMQALFTALATGRTAYYTAPLKALVSEKFFELIKYFGAHNVGMITGDSSINSNAPIVCATAEILANIALREAETADCEMVVMDEFHFYADPQRGWAWQVPLLELPQAQQVLLSATLGDTQWLEKDLSARTGRSVMLVNDAIRPVPLHYSWSVMPVNEVIQDLVATHMAPVYVVHFSQREAVAAAQELLSMSLISKEQKSKIETALDGFKFGAGFGKMLSKLLRKGIGVHHAGLLPRYRRLVEQLTQAGLLNVICGTDTLGVGINVPIRTVLITSLTKFDGTKMRHLTAREFHQIAGRAGRAGFDTVGYVVAQAPEHEIENARRIRNAGDDPAKLKRVQKVKPEEGKIIWSEKTFQTLQTKAPEVLKSQLRINHATILNLLQRPNPVRAAQRLLTQNHEPNTERNLLIRQALEIYSSLRRAAVIHHENRNWRKEYACDEYGVPFAQNPQSADGILPSRGSAFTSAIHFTKDVPSDFALNTPLSPFALSALDLLDREAPAYALDVVSVIESVQEDPLQVLIAQQKSERAKMINRLKNEGVDYYERMRIADDVTHPKPLAELLEPALNIYAQTNPWVHGHELSPKSIVRQMVEEAMTFTEFVSRYDLARSEGILLRYLTDTYRALRQILPSDVRTAEVEAIIDWLSRLVRSIDSSLLSEWEALARSESDTEVFDLVDGAELYAADESALGTELVFGADSNGEISFSRNKHSFRRAVRNKMFSFVEAIERDDLEYLAALNSPQGWNLDRWADAADDYFAEYDYLGIDTAARSENYFQVLTDPSLADLLQAGMEDEAAVTLLETHQSGRVWLVIQVLDDGENDLAWALWAYADLDASDAAGKLVLELVNFGPR
ncbi:DUF3516 domain-containing protein [Arcanobacterium hippocoleae]